MPRAASEIAANTRLRLLVLGAPKIGKSCQVIGSCPKPAYVINCDQEDSLIPVARRTTDFDWDYVKDADAMEIALKEARKGVKEGRYKTVVLDTLSSYATRLEEQCLAASNTSGNGPDGRRAYPEYEKRLRNTIERLFALEAHVVCISHYLDVGGETAEGQLAKSGKGIVPLLAGKAKATIPMIFNDVVFLDMAKRERVFITGPDGVWGPGCRNLEGTQVLPADIGILMNAMRDVRKPKKVAVAT